jgi:hypothetical protein
MRSAHTTISYQGISLRLPHWLADEWRFELPLRDFPTYCGAGNTVGEWLVPDTAHKARLSPACLIHDIEQCIGKRSFTNFMNTNNNLLRNLRACVKAQLPKGDRKKAYMHCYWYWGTCATVGWLNFKPQALNHWLNAEVRSRVDRLKKAKITS